jgi:alanine racemase
LSRHAVYVRLMRRDPAWSRNASPRLITAVPHRPVLFTLAQIADITHGRLISGDPGWQVCAIQTDSRALTTPHTLFVALSGPRFDGHSFVAQVAARAPVAALVRAGAQADTTGTAGVVEVADTLVALQALASAHRAAFDGVVIGVTGSNGKTIVKDMLAAMLARVATTHRSPASYNSQLGVALSLLELRPEHQRAVIEAGISEVGEMARLEQMIRPDVGVITTIGLAHAAGLRDLETTAREKLKLFARLACDVQDRGDKTFDLHDAGHHTGWLVYPGADATLGAMALPGRPLACWVVEDEAAAACRVGAAAFDVVAQADGFEFAVRLPDGEIARGVRLRVAGAHNVCNALAAMAAAWTQGVTAEQMKAALLAYEPTPMRLDVHTTPHGITLINDAYSSDPTSARAALAALVQHSGQGRRLAILGDMLDLGARAAAEHEALGEVVAGLRLDALVCVGEQAKGIGAGAQAAGMRAEAIFEVTGTDALHGLLERLLVAGDTVLFKGSRAVGLERAAARLLESVGPTRLYVELDAIRANFHAMRRHVGPGVRTMPVVKSFAYGNDATRVSLALVQEGADWLAVAYPDEAIPLRRLGLQVPILVLNTLAEEADKIVRYGLTGLVYSKEVAEALARQAELAGVTVEVHVKIDTGMHRVGVRPEDAVALCAWIAAQPRLRLGGVMTHLSSADEAHQDGFSHMQLERFEQALAALDEAGLRPPLVHAANTAATWRLPEARYDMVRLGLGLYGLDPSPDVAADTHDTRPAIRFVTQIIHTQQVEPGESVGYGRSWTAQTTRKIATIAAGYSDGFPRFMSNGGEVLIRGKRCPVVGKVCMDVSMVDVTEIEGAAVGDEVVLFGVQGDARIDIDELAARGNTISYEILCNISPRVRRIFIRQ